MLTRVTRVHGTGDSLLQREDLSSRDGVSVDEGEELLEDAEEGPVGQDADALLHLQAAAGDGPPVHHAEQTQPHALLLRQQLLLEGLVELDGGAVDLRTDAAIRKLRSAKLSCPCPRATLSPHADVRTKVEKTGSWYLVFRGQLSTVTPMGRQKTGTESGRGKLSESSSGYRLSKAAKKKRWRSAGRRRGGGARSEDSPGL